MGHEVRGWVAGAPSLMRRHDRGECLVNAKFVFLYSGVGVTPARA